MSSPLISICIPTYNAVSFIEETINCFIKQTYENWELIIQDDCSNDGTWELLSEKYNDNKKIRLYRNHQNLGIGKNWNKTYEKVTGELVVIFNADDLVENNFIERSVSHLQTHPTVDMVVNSYIRTDETKSENLITITKSYEGITDNLINLNNRSFYRFSWNYTLVKKKSLDKLKNKYGLFYPTQVCDAMLWYECYRQKLTAYYSGDIVGVYRIHEKNSSKIPLGEFESTFLWMLPIYSDIFSLKHPRTFFNVSKTIAGYFYKCLKTMHKPKYMVVFNLLKYGN